jgi:hypothetical protein
MASKNNTMKPARIRKDVPSPFLFATGVENSCPTIRNGRVHMDCCGCATTGSRCWALPGTRSPIRSTGGMRCTTRRQATRRGHPPDGRHGQFPRAIQLPAKRGHRPVDGTIKGVTLQICFRSLCRLEVQNSMTLTLSPPFTVNNWGRYDRFGQSGEVKISSGCSSSTNSASIPPSSSVLMTRCRESK